MDKRRFESSRDEEHDNWKNMSEYNRRLYIETHEKILPTLLRCYDRYSMGNGVEIRMPFLDYRIVCFAFSLGRLNLEMATQSRCLEMHPLCLWIHRLYTEKEK